VLVGIIASVTKEGRRDRRFPEDMTAAMTKEEEEEGMYGTLQLLEDGRSQLCFTRTLAHPREEVWRAITEPEHLAHWFPTTIEGERAAGERLRFEFLGGEAPPFEGEMLAFQAPVLMELRWGTDTVRLDLGSSGRGTVLRLLDAFDERGKAARDAAGWHTCLDALAAHLSGEPDARGSMSAGAWKDVHSAYVESFGPEAAAIGPPEGFE
jgi:uncharacterized protein YndB with AHSA1/START domain